MKKKEVTKRYAKAILLTQKIREESYDKKAAKKKEKKMKKKYPDSVCGMVDYASFYKKDIMQSAQEACVEVGLSIKMAYPIYLGMDWWNDMHDWACEILSKEERECLLEK